MPFFPGGKGGIGFPLPVPDVRWGDQPWVKEWHDEQSHVYHQHPIMEVTAIRQEFSTNVRVILDLTYFCGDMDVLETTFHTIKQGLLPKPPPSSTIYTISCEACDREIKRIRAEAQASRRTVWQRIQEES